LKEYPPVINKTNGDCAEMSHVYEVLGWIKDHWPDMSTWLITAITVFLALAPKAVADREKKTVWKIGVVAFVLFVSITGTVAGWQSTDQLKNQVSTLYGQLKFAATKNDIGTLTPHFDAGFKDMVEAIKVLP
jgi:hypothetical protein